MYFRLRLSAAVIALPLVTFPRTVRIAEADARRKDQIRVYTLQKDFENPATPTLEMTCELMGLRRADLARLRLGHRAWRRDPRQQPRAEAGGLHSNHVDED